jgi:hypothetical protein
MISHPEAMIPIVRARIVERIFRKSRSRDGLVLAFLLAMNFDFDWEEEEVAEDDDERRFGRRSPLFWQERFTRRRDNIVSALGPYTPRDGVFSTVLFNVFVHADNLVHDDHVTIRGSLAPLSWDRPLPMNRDPRNRNLWSLAVRLPIGQGEFWTGGLFEFKFCIESRSGDREIVWEAKVRY